MYSQDLEKNLGMYSQDLAFYFPSFVKTLTIPIEVFKCWL